MNTHETIWLVFALTIIWDVIRYFLLPFLIKKHNDNKKRIEEQESKLRQLLADNEVLYKQGESISEILTLKDQKQ